MNRLLLAFHRGKFCTAQIRIIGALIDDIDFFLGRRLLRRYRFRGDNIGRDIQNVGICRCVSAKSGDIDCI